MFSVLQQIDHWISGLSKFELGLLIYFFILFVIWVWTSDDKPGEKKPKKTYYKRPDYKLVVNKKRFVHEVVRWALQNIQYGEVSKSKRSVYVDISYYEHKKNHGIFFSVKNEIKIFVNNHKKIENLIDTSIHEVVHYFQFRSDPRNFQNKYKLLLEKMSYDKHPMEIEARVIAAKHVKPCIDHLIMQGFMTKNQ